jgi:hypothetical protein
LDRLARRWLEALGCRAIIPERRMDGTLAYGAVLGAPPLTLPVQARISRRRQRLLPRHVQEFAGSLARSGTAVGLLVATGPVAPDAWGAADLPGVPRVRLLSADEWLRELAFHRVGVTFQVLPVWLIRPGGPAPGVPAGGRPGR